MSAPAFRVASGLVWAASLFSSPCAGAADAGAPKRGPAAQESESGLLSRMPSQSILGFRFTGNTAYSDAELLAIARPYIGRTLVSGALEDARTAITRHYAITNHHVNSGAVIRDQVATNGVVEMSIIEGRLTEINLRGNRWLRSDALEARVRAAAKPPLDIVALRDRLEVLQEDSLIQRVNAELSPGLRPGESRLDIEVREHAPYILGVEINNSRPASVGAEMARLFVGHRSVTGRGDAFELWHNLAERSDNGVTASAFDNWGLRYSLPFTARGTTAGFSYQRNDFVVQEEPFDALDIQSQSAAYSFELRQPLMNSLKEKLSTSVSFDWRESESFLLGTPFSFSAGAARGQMVIRALRWSADYLRRGQDRLVAFRSTLSLGLNAFGATDNGTDRDGRFLSWIGQAQYVERLGANGPRLLVSVNGQWADDPLLSLEQFSLGGRRTVRGYRENQLVRDTGINLSIELRAPLWRDGRGRETLQLAPFFDYGGGWNRKGPSASVNTLASAGLGLIFTPNSRVAAEVYWGGAFRDFDSSDNDLQDLGLHFQLRLSGF